MLLAAVALDRHAVDVLPHRDALCHVHGERRLADGRARRHHYHVARLEPAELLVEMLEPCGEPLELVAAPVEEPVHRPEGVVDGSLPVRLDVRRAAYLQEALLHLAEEDVGVGAACVVEAAPLRLTSSVYDLAQKVLLAHHVDVVFGVRGRGRVLHKRLYGRHSAHGLEAARGAKAVVERHHVDGHRGAAHLLEGLEEDAVARLVEGVGRYAARET